MARPRRHTYSLQQYLSNKIEGYISNDADTQRNPAWKQIVDGLAVTVLSEDYIPVIILAEEDNGQIHIVDGGSRTAALEIIRYGNHKIKSSVDDPIIKYKKRVKDADGKMTWEEAEFDIRNKTFEQFPKELQKIFDEYQIDTVIHEHCDKEQIAKYIKRYNDHKCMSAHQKMFLYIPKFAEYIREICNNEFFVNNNVISDNDKENGLLERIVSEAVMCMFHLEKWNKNGKKVSIYLNENSVKEEFEKLGDNIERLNNVITDESKSLFNNKDTFIWLTLFNKFTELGLADSKFGEFLNAFVNGLRNNQVDGELFDKVDGTGSTKDKKVVITKLHILETLMLDFLHIKEIKNETTESFVAEMVDMPVEKVKEEMDLYEESLKDLENNTIRDGSKLLEVANHLSLLAMVAYSYKNDVDLDDWLEEYAENNNTYSIDQRKNYSHMVNDFKQYQKRVAIA